MWYLIIFNIMAIIFYTILWKRHAKEIDQAYLKKRKEELDKNFSDKIQHQELLDVLIQERSRALQSTKSQLQDLRIERDRVKSELENYELNQRQKVDNNINEYETQRKQIIDQEIKETYKIKQKVAEDQHQAFIFILERERTSKLNEIDSITSQLESYRAKQETINQEILRRRELEEKADFYRVCLSEEAISDITELQIVRQKLKKPEILDKIIYDTYVAKPVLEMIKRVLQNSTCSGIYKITCQETKEVYIGKSTDVKNRWQQHCKTAFNCGTIASSLLHRKMQQYGIENFTFELLETVPKDKLSEREKFYIDFYKTKETGLNERSG